MKIEFCDLKSQYLRLKEDIDAGIQLVLNHGQYILGPEVAELEEKLAAYIGAKYCITVANGTDALQIAQMALGVGPGDEVITPGFTYIATAETVGPTGVEMEALTVVQIALLTIYDMCKAADKRMVITGVQLLEKHGGKSGSFVA